VNLGVAIDAFLTHLSVERGLSAATVEAYGRDLAALRGRRGSRVGALDAAAAGHVDALRAARPGRRDRTRSRRWRGCSLARRRGDSRATRSPTSRAPSAAARCRFHPRRALALVRAPLRRIGLRDRAPGGRRRPARLGLTSRGWPTAARLAQLHRAGQGRRERLALLGDRRAIERLASAAAGCGGDVPELFVSRARKRLTRQAVWYRIRGYGGRWDPR
jgi:site-specific recombinase XerD